MSYDPDTGIFRWRGVLTGRGYCYSKTADGVEAGSKDKHGYRLIHVDGKLYRANRLAYFYMTGEWPTNKVDHRDGDPTNDRWGNLRAASDSDNAANARISRNNQCGFKGVHQDHKRLKPTFVAQICKNRKRYFLGRFSTAEEAHAAYIEAAKRYFGEFARAA